MLFRGLKIDECKVEIFSYAKDRNALRFFKTLNLALEVEANHWLSIQVYETVKLAFDASVVDLFFDLDLISNEDRETGLLYTDSYSAISTAIADYPNARSAISSEVIVPEKKLSTNINDHSGTSLINKDELATNNLYREIGHTPVAITSEPELNHQFEYTDRNFSVSKKTLQADDEPTLAGEELVLVNDDLTLADDELVLVNDELTLADDELALVDDDLTLADDELALVDDDLTLADDELALVDGSFLVADNIYAIDEDDYASEQYFFIPEIDELKENPCDPILGKIQISREYRAEQKALDFITKYEWSLKDLDIVFKVFMQSGWSATRVALERECERGLTPDELMLALSLKNFWASEERFWISFAKNGSYQLSQYILSWPTALAIVKSFESYPQEEELHLLMDEYLDYWMNHKVLHKAFPSFRVFLWFRFFDGKSTLPATENGLFQHNEYCPPSWTEGTDIVGFRLQQDMDAYGIERVHVSSKHLRFGKNGDGEPLKETPDQDEAEEE